MIEVPDFDGFKKEVAVGDGKMIVSYIRETGNVLSVEELDNIREIMERLGFKFVYIAFGNNKLRMFFSKFGGGDKR